MHAKDACVHQCICWSFVDFNEILDIFKNENRQI